MQLLVAFPVMLPREGFAARIANEGPFVRMGALVGPQIISARERFVAEFAMEI